MPIAEDGQGNFLTLDDTGTWVPATIAEDPQTGQKLVRDGAEWKPLPGQEPSVAGSALRGVARGATFGFADELRAGTDAVAQGARNVFGAAGPTMGETYDRSLAANREAFRQDDATNPKASMAGQIAGGVGGALAMVPIAEAAGAAGLAAPLAARMNPLLLRAAEYGGVGGLAGGVTGFGEGQGAGGRLAGAATGAATGGGIGLAGGAAVGALGRVISPVRVGLTPEQAALRTAATAEGIPLSIGQETGSRTLTNAEAALAQLPGSSGAAANFAQTQQRALNRAVLARAGEAADIATPDVLNRARNRIGGVINDIANRNTLQITPALDQRLAQVEDSLRFLPNEAATPVRARLEQLRGMVMRPQPSSGGVPTIPGASYRMMDSQLGRSIKATTNGDLRAALTDIRETLRGAMDASISPADAAEWAQARRHYANLMVAADAAGGAGGATAEGNISPLALRTALDRSTGRGYVWGRGDLNDIARIGQSVLRQPPDSGTSGRSVMNNLLTGSMPVAGAGTGAYLAGPAGAAVGAAAPFVLPYAAQRVMTNPLFRAWMLNQAGTGLHGRLPLAATASVAGERVR